MGCASVVNEHLLDVATSQKSQTKRNWNSIFIPRCIAVHRLNYFTKTIAMSDTKVR